MCGAKQSLKRNYGKGNGKDCRHQVMKLNKLKIENQNKLIQEQEQSLESDEENDIKPHPPESEKKQGSKWTQFLDEDDLFELHDEEDEIENINIFDDNVNKRKKICHEKVVNTTKVIDVQQNNSLEVWKNNLMMSDKDDFLNNCNESKINTLCNYNLIDSQENNVRSKKRKYNDIEHENKIINHTTVVNNVNISSNIFDSDPGDLDKIINMSF
ncbi:hypothetical protein RUM43_012959 [Polyplax serrata]|uniref:MRN complex-interacting protein N-terminal domain-containing protein n=1 Tax=Polyplax serrata TaxID=468196 RepID=A0AAN8NJJ3_POLSC